MKFEYHALMQISRTLRLALLITVTLDTSLLRTQTLTDLLPLKNRMSAMNKISCRLLHIIVSDDGSWNVFTGDQLGAMFAAWVLRGWRASGKPLGW